ncbi:peroxiredoxin [Armatimonadota bacterium]|nr:peroxiredoxin [Armatimonadota bacterium]
MTQEPQIGDVAPDFSATTHDGTPVRLSDFRGKQNVVLVFYPGDSTPTCTSQLCAFRDSWESLQQEDATILGINPFSAESHTRFVKHYQFPFPLVVDKGSEIAKAYGRAALFGMLIKRAVYIIDKAGKIAYAQPGNPPPNEVLAILQTLQGK